MVSNPIHQAVVLATQATTDGGRPLALVRSGGVPLLKRTLLSLRREGIRRFVVVYADASVRRALHTDAQLQELEIVWVLNAERPAEDGFSLLRARPHLRGEYFVVPADRVFAPAVIRRLLEEPLDGVTLAVAEPSSVEPAVRRPGLGVGFGPTFDVTQLRPTAAAGDGEFVGIAAGGRDLLDAVEAVAQSGGLVTLTRAYARLASKQSARVARVQDARWQDLYTAAGRRAADGMLIRGLRKSVDGIIARHINRRFSLAMSRLLMHTPVRPNHVTAFSLMVSIAAAVVAAMATASSPLWLLAGAVLWQLASMLDGIDGELARLKFAESKFGEWFDTLTDDVGKFAFFIGSGVGVTAVTGDSMWLALCVIGVGVQLTLSLSLYRKLVKTGSGSHYALAWELPPNPSRAARLYQRIEFMSRRDYYVFVWLVLTAVSLVHIGIVLMFATTCVVLAHELLRPRQVREEFVLRP